MADKKFGLIIPKKVDKFKMRANPIFDDESDEEEKKRKRPKIPQKKIDMKDKLKMESLDDPSIYEYDSIYDDMKAKETKSIAPTEKKNSRYIDTLLKAADKRKKEYERRIDKKIQLEREKEGDLYKDKEAFVTSSYKKKLEEKELEDERERRENLMNDMMDVRNQKDLSGFYRHFLKQTVGEEKVPAFGEKYIKQETSCSKDSDSPEKVIENIPDNVNFKDIDQDSDGIEIDSDSDKSITAYRDTYSSRRHDDKKTSQKYDDRKENTFKSKAESHTVSKDKSKFSQHGKSKKTYRTKNPVQFQRSSSSDSDSNEDVDHNKRSRADVQSKAESHRVSKDKSKFSQHGKSTKTYKKKSSSSSSGSESNEDVDHNKRSRTDVQNTSKTDVHKPRHDSSSSSSSSSDYETNNKPQEKSDKPEEQNKVTKKTRSSIYAKRTVGDIFTAAQARYFQRMALKNEK